MGYMIKLTKEKDKIVGVFGLARTGESVYRALKDADTHAICYDDSEKNREEFAKKHGNEDLIPITDEIWKKARQIIISPGVPTTLPQPHPVVELARKLAIPFMGDIDILCLERVDAQYIAITGTNGKSTTTSLIHHILGKHAKKWDIGGNIGNAVLNMDHQASGYVLELSSYQIELLKDFKANIAVLLNITPDHLDRHGTIENYTEVKKSLVKNAATSIIGIDNPITRMVFDELKSTHKLIPISTKEIIENGVCVKDGKIYDRMDGVNKEYTLFPNKSLQGEHNFENIAASFAVTKLYNIDADLIISQIGSFNGLPHRMQYLGSKLNIDFYNDSKATNAEAASKSLGSLKNIYWLAGGIAKAGGIKSLLPLKANIKKAYLYGDAKYLFEQQLKGVVPYQIFNSLEEAFMVAVEDAKLQNKPANIVLAPACSSLDQFKDFEERGCYFIELYDNL
jgi:UDP-N-acetylmuramoylalanine--D-glutamate ligase